MGRKSLAPERRAQILEAFEEIILEKGLDGASIGAVAAAAGMDRTLVHHYFGSRAALEEALVERLVAAYKDAHAAVVAALPPEARVGPLLDYLFGEDFCDSRRSVLFDELFSASNRSPGTRALLRRVYEDFEQIARDEIDKTYPEAPAERRREVAYAIMCLAEASSGFLQLGFPKGRSRAARAAAETLLRDLRNAAAP